MLKCTAQQKLAITSPLDKHTVVVAGPGSGKTWTISQRVKYMLKKVLPANIVVLSFTRKAAEEILSRTNSEVTCSTFHSFALSVAKEYPNNFKKKKILGQADQQDLMEISINKLGTNVSSDKMVQGLSWQRNTGSRHYSYGGKAEDVQKTLTDYNKQKISQGYSDFDDILVDLDKELSNKVFCSQLARKYKYILVDEFQDINPLSWSILKKLVEYGVVLYVVGDPAQAIYGFRGSDCSTILNFTKLLPANKIILDTNFRSTQLILNASNAVINDSEIAYNRNMVGIKGDGKLPYVMSFGSRQAETHFIAKNIKDPEQTMVIIRTTFDAADFETAFIQQGVPYTYVGGQSLLNNAHVQDYVAFLKASQSNDHLSWYRFLKLLPGIGDVTATKLLPFVGTNQIPAAAKVLIDAIKKSPTPVKSGIPLLENVLRSKYPKNFEKVLKDLRKLPEVSVNSLEQQKSDKETGGCLLITAHSSKGMERDTVFVSKAQPGSFPHYRGELEEERRLLYVAMTRARTLLVLTRVADSRKQEGQDFLDIDKSLISSHTIRRS